MFINKCNDLYLPLLPSHRASQLFGRYTFSILLRVGGWVGLGGWLHTHLSTNQARRTVTSVTDTPNDATTAPCHHPHYLSFWLVAWHSGRSSVFGRQTFPDLRSTCSWRVTTYVGKPSAISQPTGPTQPFIPSRSIDE